MLLEHVEKECSCAWWSDQGQNDQKQCLAALWLLTSQSEHFHKGKFLYALTLSLNTEGQRLRSSCRATCPLSKCPHSTHVRAGQALMQKLPVVSRWSCGIFIQDLKAHWGCPRCKPPCGCAAQTGLLAEWMHLKMDPAAPLRPPHPTTSP